MVPERTFAVLVPAWSAPQQFDAWNVRAVCRHPHLCSVCRELGLNRQHLTVQRCDVADYVQKESCSVGKPQYKFLDHVVSSV